MANWRVYVGTVLPISGLIIGISFYLMLGAIAEVNPLQTAIAGEPPPTMEGFLTHGKTFASLMFLAFGLAGAASVAVVWLGGTASDLGEGGYLRRLRRDARASFDKGENPSPVLIAAKMLEIEKEEDGWQIETIKAYLDTAKKDPMPIDGEFLTMLSSFCKHAHAAADEVLAKGSAEPWMKFGGRDWDASELVTEAVNIVDRIRALRHRDSRPSY